MTAEDLRSDQTKAIDAAIARARKDERERIALLVDDFPWGLPVYSDKAINQATDDAAESVCKQIATAIRHMT